MKITVQMSDSEMEEILRMANTDKKGPAIRSILTEALMRQRRIDTAQKFLTGEWSTELEGYEQSREKDRESTTTLAEAWRD